MSSDSTNGLVNSILSMAITKSIPQDNIPKDILNDVKSLFPQKITHQQITKVKNLISKGTFCFEAVEKSNISFPFKPDLLIQLIVYTNFIEKEPNISSAIILFSFLSWCVSHYNTNTSDYLSILFEVLKTLANNCKQPNIKSIAISSIYNLLLMIIPKKLDNIDLSAKIEIIDGIIISIPNLPPYFFDIFVKASHIAVDNSHSDASSSQLFIKLIVKVLKQYPDKLPKNVVNIIAPLIAQQVGTFNKPTIEYIALVSQIYGLEPIQPLLPAILLLFTTQIKENSIFPKADTFEKNIEPISLRARTSEPTQDKQLFQHETDLTGHLDFNTIPVQFTTEKLTDIISPNLKSFLSFIIGEFKGKAELVQSLINLFKILFDKDNEYTNSYDSLAFFILFISNLYGQCKFEAPIHIIMHRTIFNPAFTVFKQEENWRIVNSLRNRSIEFLFYSMNDEIYKFISEISKYPLFFAEIMYRISNFIENININPNFVNIYYNILLETNNFYQSYSNLNGDEIESIKKARFSIFYVFNKLTQNSVVIDHLFSNERFMHSFTTLIFEEPLLPLVFSSISSYSARTLITEDSVFNQAISDVLKEASKHFDDPDCLSKCVLFLSTINEYIVMDDNLLQMFERTISSLCSCLISLPNTKVAESFLIASIQFLTLETKFHHLRSIESSQLEASIIQLAGSNPSINYFNVLIQLAAGSSYSTTESSFNVEQPKAFRILLHIFSNSTLLVEIIEFIERLCKTSQINTKKFHEEGIDIDLLEIILSYREKKEPDEQERKIVNEILSLFSYIEDYSSSVAVVEKFITLFCLVNGKYLPWFHSLTIDTFISLITKNKEEEEEMTLIPFNHSSSFQVVNLKNEMISHGFTFCCWIYSNSSLLDYVEHLITIYDQKGKEISIMHNFSSILIITSNQAPIEVEFLLISHEWTLVSIAFKFVKKSENELFVISIYNNDQLVKEVTIPSVKFERNVHSLNCTLGGTAEDSIDIEIPSCSSQFSLYPYLEINQILNLQQLGSSSYELNYNPYFVFIPNKPYDTIVLENVVPNSPISSLTEVASLTPTSFSDVFINRCGVDLILPIFAQWGMTFENETEMTDLPEKSIKILHESLIKSEEAQRTFDEAHGIEIVSFLLLSAKKKNIVFSLYKSLYNLYTKITDKKLKVRFFSDILTNIDIWINSAADDHLKIIRIWKQLLFPNSMEIVGEDRSFKWVINLMRIYYYYVNCEPEIQRERPEGLDIPAIRKNLLILSVNLASYRFSSSDLCYLICTITGCADSSQQMDYLRLFNEMLKKGSVSPLLKAKDSFGYIKIIQYLSNSKNKGISIVSMQTLVNAFRSQVLTTDSDRMVDIFLHLISKEMISKEYFDILLTVVKKDTPELFPIMAWMAMNLGEETIQVMYDELQPSESYVRGCAWCVWPIITMFRFSATTARKIASFLIRCSVNNFEQIYTYIDTIGMVMKRTTDDMKSLLIDELLKCIRSSETINESYLRIYYTFTHHFLFFRAQPNEKDKLTRLDKLVKESPFADQLPDIQQVRQFQELINILRTRPKFNSDGSERYSPEMAQKALQIVAPRINEDENYKQENKLLSVPAKEGDSNTNAFPIPQFRPTVTFTSNLKGGQSIGQPRKNLLRRNSIFTITKATEASTLAPQRKTLRLAPPQANVKRRGAKAIISSQMNYFLANDSLAIFSELFFNPIHYFFGIRQGSLANNEKNHDYMINWLDKDTAVEFLKIYAEKPLADFESTVVLISAFLIFQDPILSMTSLSRINVEHQQSIGSLSFYDRNAIRSNQNPMFNKTTPEQIAYESTNFLNNFTSQTDENINSKWKKIIDQIKEYEDKNSLSANETFNLITPSLVAITTDAIADFCDSLSQLKTQCNKYWQQLWHVISIERAPWNKSLPPNMIQQSHYRRDLSLCYAGFSPKLKKNYKFDIHLEASLVRDTGDEETGRSKTEELKEQLKTMYAQGSEAYSLFEISDQSMKEEKSNSVFTASKCIIELPCEIIKVDKVYEDCSFLLLEDSIVLTIIDKKSTVIELSSVKCIFPRTRCHHMTAIEIFTNDGITYFVNFPNFSSAQVLKSFRDKVKIQPCDFKSSLQQSKMTEKWQHREISNFQYLMTLNLHSGRTTNDLSQYPVFPWVISDYKSDEIDLNDPSVYRDLSKPIGAVNSERLEELKEKSEQLKGMGMSPYLYSSCFSCPFIVCLFLIRLEPFTSLHIDIQGGHFDVSSRIFSSIQEAYKLCNINHNDYRELIPEFFMMPEFLVNRDHFDLGVASDKKIDDVELPKWAHNNPLEFIYKNRKALESEYVTKNLNNWIDLIWGEKQRGEKAWKADNVYIKEMYADIWDETPLDDVNQRANVEAILTHVGQIPPLLFDKPHPVADPLQTQAKSPIFEEIKMPITTSIECIDLKQIDKNIVAFIVDKNNKFYSFTYDPLSLPKLSSKTNNKSSIQQQSQQVQSRARTSSLKTKSSSQYDSNIEHKIGSINKPMTIQRPDSSLPSIDRDFDSSSSSSSMSLTRPHRSRTYLQKLNSLMDSPAPSSDDESILVSDERSQSSSNSRIASLNSIGSISDSSNLFSQSSLNSSTSIASMIAKKNKKKSSSNYSFNGSNAFIFSSDKTHDIFKVTKTSDVSKLGFKHRSAIKLIAADYKWTAIADGDSVVSIYSEEELKFTIPLFASDIKCLSLCSLYHLMVCGTKDGFLLFSSLNSGTITKTVNLNGMKPIKLLVTPSWGFVAAYIIELEEGKINHYIKLFTVNGDLIRSTKINAPVQSWKAFNTFKGFDYILMTDSRNDCYLFEAFYLEFDNPFYTSDKPISAISFVNTCNCVVLADDAGHLTFITVTVPE